MDEYLSALPSGHRRKKLRYLQRRSSATRACGSP